MTTMTDKGNYGPYGFGSSTIEYIHIKLIIDGLTPLIGQDNQERIRRAAYCGGLEAALVSIQRITGHPQPEPNNFFSLRHNLWMLDVAALAAKLPNCIVVGVDLGTAPGADSQDIPESYYPDQFDESDECPECGRDWDDCRCDDDYDFCPDCQQPTGDCLCEIDDDGYDPEIDFGQPDPFEASLPDQAGLSSNGVSRTIQDSEA